MSGKKKPFEMLDDGEWSRKIERLSLPVLDTAFLNSTLGLTDKISSRLEAINEPFRHLADQLSSKFSFLSDFDHQISPILQRYALHESRCKRMKKAGWLPNPAAPWFLLDDEDTSDLSLSTNLESWYSDNFDYVAELFKNYITICDIDEEAKFCFF